MFLRLGHRVADPVSEVERFEAANVNGGGPP